MTVDEISDSLNGIKIGGGRGSVERGDLVEVIIRVSKASLKRSYILLHKLKRRSHTADFVIPEWPYSRN